MDRDREWEQPSTLPVTSPTPHGQGMALAGHKSGTAQGTVTSAAGTGLQLLPGAPRTPRRAQRDIVVAGTTLQVQNDRGERSRWGAVTGLDDPGRLFQPR